MRISYIYEKWYWYAGTYFSWQVKEDHEEFRVMYRPGPQGTPFHSLLVEGYVDGTVDTCKFMWIIHKLWALSSRMSKMKAIILHKLKTPLTSTITSCRFMHLLGGNTLQKMVIIASILVSFFIV
jgi:hypothetical protein